MIKFNIFFTNLAKLAILEHGVVLKLYPFEALFGYSWIRINPRALGKFHLNTPQHTWIEMNPITSSKASGWMEYARQCKAQQRVAKCSCDV